jgi:hypothetical protein
MCRVKTGLIAAASALLLCWGAEARAEKVAWSYNWTPSSTEILSDSGQSKLILSNEPIGKASTIAGNSTDVVATNIKTVSSVDAGTLDTFTNQPFSLAVTLTDGASNSTGTLTFTGLFNGTLNSGAAKIVASITGSLVQSIMLGGNKYTVTMGQPNQYSAPSPPDSTNLGSISASATVGVSSGGGPGGGPTDSPEPTSLVLAGLGLISGAGYMWKRRARKAAALPA